MKKLFLLCGLFGLISSSLLAQQKITLHSSLPIGEKIELRIEAQGEVSFVGLKEKFKEGEYENGRYAYTTTSQEIEIIGSVSEFDCNANSLTSLSAEGHTTLVYLACYNNRINKLLLNNCPRLEEVFCQKNLLTSLELKNCPQIISIDCSQNKLTQLNLEDSPKLDLLWCYRNQLKTLAMVKSQKLKEIQAFENLLPEISLENFPKLTLLNVANNQLRHLDFSMTPAIRTIVCHSNEIKSKEMGLLIKSLPVVQGNSGVFVVVNSKNKKEGNICLKSDVAIAKEKNWISKDFNGSPYKNILYEGSEEDVKACCPISNNNIHFFANQKALHVENNSSQAMELSIYNLNGLCYYTDSLGINENKTYALSPNSYILKIADKYYKFIIQ